MRAVLGTLVGAAVLAVPSTVRSQRLPDMSQNASPSLANSLCLANVVQAVDADSGPVDNTSNGYVVVFDEVIEQAGAPWVRITFDEAGVRLPGDSFIRVASIFDDSVQHLDARRLRQWQNRTAFFNGPAVRVQLFAGPNTSDNSLRASRLIFGVPEVFVASICGDDDRMPSHDRAVGRLVVGDGQGVPIDCCTTTIYRQDGAMVSAGHCSVVPDLVEFNVPPSLPDGMQQHPSPSDQYPVDPASIRANYVPSEYGTDWMVFRCHEGSEGGLNAYERQGSFYRPGASLPPVIPFPPTVRIVGYGNASGTAHRAQQLADGYLTEYDFSQNPDSPFIRHLVDTEPGDSGAAILSLGTPEIVGIHTGGDYPCSGARTNSGTPITYPQLKEALACTAPEITNQPSSVRVCDGGEVTLWVEANGAGLHYQWSKNGQDIPNTDAGTLVLGKLWTLRSHSGPPARYSHALAYDSTRRVVVLFGGRADPALFGDTWEWNGADWTNRAVPGPSARLGHAMVFDKARNRTVLFGGNPNICPEHSFPDTWEWDGQNWTLRSTSGPGPRSHHAMAYDESRQVSVLFGGDRGCTAPLGDTWEWNGNVWTLRATTGPSPRVLPSLAYDSVRGVVVLFGGYTGDANDERSTWEWDGVLWRVRASNGPSSRAGSALAYSPRLQATVLFGGYYGSAFADTWTWNGTDWRRVSLQGPSARFGHAMAYDAERNVAVLFGGSSDSGAWPPSLNALNDLWEFGRGPAPAGTDTYDVVVNNNCGSIRSNPAEVVVLPVVTGDFDCDARPGVTDIRPFLSCFGGPDVPLAATCGPGDADIDGDSDLSDFATFQNAFATP